MSAESSIEWTDSTWNPSTGCTKISPGCANCYIERTPPFRMAGRKFVNGKIPLLLHEDRLDAPLHWKKPRRIFVNSLSDLFHDDVPDELITKVLGVIVYCRRHTFQVLTKRPKRMREALRRLTLEDCLNQACLAPDFLPTWPPENLILGVSVENRKHGMPRIEHLRETPAAVRMLSIEPLLEDLGQLDLSGIGWVIVGGESGTGARPMHPLWPRRIRDQCVKAGVPFFFKQWGELAPLGKTSGLDPNHFYPGRGNRASVMSGVPMDEPTSMFRIGKKAAGRLLDGREWNEMPQRSEVHA